MKLSEIQELIKFVSRSGVSEVELELKDFKIVIKTPPRKKRGELILHDADTVVVQPVVPGVAAPTHVVVTPPTPGEDSASTPAATTGDESEEAADSNLITVKAPMIGTFYRASAPDKPPFVSVGDEVVEGDVIFIIEAMKLFNEIEAEVSGKIVKVLVDDASPVEYDQPIFLVEPH
ncbi:MAG: acetyl-CoA carboxylase, biotin carboxyl carrier protein [Bacteroidetes bacterium]|nr:MAG: acetyl-CoA carboxylase, biotin carboxyl carrier protein [Bacteroidota bacterium]